MPRTVTDLRVLKTVRSETTKIKPENHKILDLGFDYCIKFYLLLNITSYNFIAAVAFIFYFKDGDRKVLSNIDTLVPNCTLSNFGRLNSYVANSE
jgi:hypothetical protein